MPSGISTGWIDVVDRCAVQGHADLDRLNLRGLLGGGDERLVEVVVVQSGDGRVDLSELGDVGEETLERLGARLAVEIILVAAVVRASAS